MSSSPRARRRRLVAAAASVAVVTSGLVATAVPVAAAPPSQALAKIKPELAAALATDDTADFWIRVATEASPADATTGANAGADMDWAQRGATVVDHLQASAAESQADVLAILDEANASYQSFWATNAVFVDDGSQDLAEALADIADVEALWPSRTYGPVEPIGQDTDETAIQAVEWGIANINADDVWASGIDGGQIVIGSIDSGVQYDHPALVGSYRGNLGDGTFSHDYNWLDTSGSCSDGAPCDNNGHGTHTMGTMVGSEGDTNQVGVAPGATWITANGCDTCSDVDLIEAAQWMLAPTRADGTEADPSKRPHIVNNSWGSQVPSNDPFMEDIQQAWAAAGIFGVWSNGNNGPGCSTSGSPGSRALNFSVGAYDVNNTIASFSSRGAGQDGTIKPDIAAPGVNIRSAIPGSRYGTSDGTSMAAPHAAGAIALLWSAHPELIRDIQGTWELLDQTAIDTENLQCGGTAENNNVFGEGRLDALALVEAGDRGPVGTLDGTLTDAGTGDPLVHGTVQVTGGDIDRTVTAGPDGTYQTTLPVGDYTVRAHAFGYEARTGTVTITENATTSHDAALTAQPTATISGTVTDGSGQGWPLYARITAEGVPGGVYYTDPTSGDYSITMPVGSGYDLAVEPLYPGYTTVTEHVDLSEDTARDVAVPVESMPCLAPGYALQQPKIAAVTWDPGAEFTEFFADNGVAVDFYGPADLDQIVDYDVVLWAYNTVTPTDAGFASFLSATDAAGTGVVFLDYAYGTWNGIASLSTFTDQPASVDRINGSGGGTFYRVTQEHPVFDGFEVGDVLEHEAGFGERITWFTGYEGDGRQVIGEAGGHTRGVQGAGVGVQQRPGNRHVLLSMNARSAPEWQADSVQLFWNAITWVNPTGAGFDCAPSATSLVVGDVTDANTGDGVAGAMVSVGDETVETMATPDDDTLGDGFYWMITDATGSQSMTASATKYESDTRDTTIDDFTVADFTLRAGQVTVEPTEIDTSVDLGQDTDSGQFTVTNTGTAPVDLNLGERDRDFVLLGADGSTQHGQDIAAAAGAPLRELDVPVAVGSSAPADDAVDQAAAGETATGDDSAPSAEPWTNLPNYPQAIMDNAVVRLDGKIYSIGGSNGASATSAVWMYDPATLAWSQVAPLPAARNAMAAAVVDGRIVATGGWTSGGPAADTWTYDPATDTWTPAATNPAPRAGAATAVVNGLLYVIGGCTTSGCSPMSDSVVAYDAAADTWESLASYPTAVAFAACGALDWTIVCSGGINGTAGTNQTHAYDPGTDTWTRVANAPTDAWGSSYAVANDQLVVVGGVRNGLVSNAAFAYHAGTDSWSPLPNANESRYRGGAACGFYKIGGAIQNYQTDSAAEMLPGFDDCVTGSPEVTWLAVDQDKATLAVGESVTVTVTTEGLVDQPGTYTAAVSIQESTPYPQTPVVVTMTVSPPRTWGKVSGVIEAVACDGTTAPLAGATVQLMSDVLDRAFVTDADGRYAYWVDATGTARFTVAAAKDGYTIEVTAVRPRPRRETTADLDLDQVGCR